MILLIEPSGGLAGDMLLAALLDLEHPDFALEDLRRLARSLVPEEVRLELSVTERGGFRARRLDVLSSEGADPPHRHLAELLARVGDAGLPAPARARAALVLRRLAEAEARAHGLAVEEVHFHEIGAVDTLVDVCGAALALERLGIARVVATAPYVGGGTVACAHGELPVPAPGTAELLQGIPHRRGPGGERLTPTGAAILTCWVDAFEPEETLTISRQGIGAGARDPAEGPPNLARVALCAGSGSGAGLRAVWQLECNLDDASGEEIAFVCEALRAAGALDVWCIPAQMKKGRPGVLLQALARPEGRAALESALLAHTPTLGLRWIRGERRECERRELVVEVEGRTVRVKQRLRPGGGSSRLDLSPEHEDLAAAARATGIELRRLEEAAVEAARAWLARQPPSP